MSRFIQEVKRPSKPKIESTKELSKPGSYTVKDLENSKKIYSNTGGKY